MTGEDKAKKRAMSNKSPVGQSGLPLLEGHGNLCDICVSELAHARREGAGAFIHQPLSIMGWELLQRGPDSLVLPAAQPRGSRDPEESLRA